MHRVLLGLLAASILTVAKEDIIVFHAGSLAVPFAKIEKAFEAKYPQYDVKREPSGSRTAARKVSELKRPCDVVASADYKVIDNLLIPKDARFNAQFATNEMAIAYTPHSKFASQINVKNWPEILLKQGVKTGHSNPNVDPCGYRAVLVAQLAEQYYRKPGFFKALLGYGAYYKAGEAQKSTIVVRPKETDLLALLEAHAIDYLFIYKSVAQQHGLKYLTLPEAISLKSKTYDAAYQKAHFKITGKKPGSYLLKKGGAMIYGVTIPQNASSPAHPEGAVAFVKFLLSPEGEKIMRESGQGSISPALITGDATLLKAD